MRGRWVWGPPSLGTPLYLTRRVDHDCRYARARNPRLVLVGTIILLNCTTTRLYYTTLLYYTTTLCYTYYTTILLWLAVCSSGLTRHPTTHLTRTARPRSMARSDVVYSDGHLTVLWRWRCEPAPASSQLTRATGPNADPVCTRRLGLVPPPLSYHASNTNPNPQPQTSNLNPNPDPFRSRRVGLVPCRARLRRRRLLHRCVRPA